MIEAPPTPPRSSARSADFIDQSISNVGCRREGAGETFGGATDAAGDLAKGVGDAAGTVARLPLTNVVTGKEMCASRRTARPIATRRAWRCARRRALRAAASLDITSVAQVSRRRLWRERREPNDSECVNEAFVSSAIVPVAAVLRPKSVVFCRLETCAEERP